MIYELDLKTIHAQPICSLTIQKKITPPPEKSNPKTNLCKNCFNVYVSTYHDCKS